MKRDLKGDATRNSGSHYSKKIEAMRHWTPQLLSSHFPTKFSFVPICSPSSLRGEQDSWPENHGLCIPSPLDPLKTLVHRSFLSYYSSSLLRHPYRAVTGGAPRDEEEEEVVGSEVGFQEFWKRPAQFREPGGYWEDELTGYGTWKHTEGKLA